MNIRDNPPLSAEDFRANLNRAMELHAASQLPLGAQSHFEIVTPDPASAQLRLEIVEAIAKALGLNWPSEVDEVEAFEVVDKAVMPVVDELAARARYMREAAELLTRNVQSLSAELTAQSGTVTLPDDWTDRLADEMLPSGPVSTFGRVRRLIESWVTPGE